MAQVNPKSAEWFRDTYVDISTSGIVLASGAGAAAVVALKAGWTIFVQKITIVITTVAAQTITVRDNAGTPVNILLLPVSQATPVTVDYGARGFGLTVSKQLDIAGTAGPAYAYVIEGYMQQTNVSQAFTNDRTV